MSVPTHALDDAGRKGKKYDTGRIAAPLSNGLGESIREGIAIPD
jgi:hypothetical protein